MNPGSNNSVRERTMTWKSILDQEIQLSAMRLFLSEKVFDRCIIRQAAAMRQ